MIQPRTRNLYKIREKIQSQLGFILVKQPNGSRVYPMPPLARGNLKTKRMLEIEKEERQPIEALIYRGSIEDLAVQFNTMPTTIQVWRNLLRVHWTEKYLPKCEGCYWRDAVCHPHALTGNRRCRILKMCGQNELLDIKDKSVMGKDRSVFLG
jgi:hypothetical protein